MKYLEFLRLWRDHRDGAWLGEWVDIARLAPLAFGNRDVVRANGKPLPLPDARPLDRLSDSTDAEVLKATLAQYLSTKVGKRIYGFLIEQESTRYRLTTVAPVSPLPTALPENRKKPDVDAVVKLCGKPFTRCYVKLFERTTDPHAALMLAQLVYWREVYADADGWVRKTAEEWQAATGLTRREQQRAREKLAQLPGLWLEERTSRCETRYALGTETAALCTGRFIPFRPALFAVVRDVKASLLLASGLAWSAFSREQDGSFSRSKTQWCQELALGRQELATALERLKGIWHTATDAQKRQIHWLDTEVLLARLTAQVTACTKTTEEVHQNHQASAPDSQAGAPKLPTTGTLKKEETKRQSGEKRGTVGPSAPQPSLRSGDPQRASGDASAAPTRGRDEASLDWTNLFYRLNERSEEIDRRGILDAYRKFLGYKQVSQAALWALHEIVIGKRGTMLTSPLLIDAIKAATQWAHEQGKFVNHNPAAIGVELDKRIEEYWEGQRLEAVAASKRKRNQRRWGRHEDDGLL